MLQFHFYLAQLDQFIYDGINGKSGCRMNLQLAGNVAPVGNDGMYRNKQFFCNLLIGHASYYTANNFFFSLAQSIQISIFLFGKIHKYGNLLSERFRIVEKIYAVIVTFQLIGIDKRTKQRHDFGFRMLIMFLKGIDIEPALKLRINDQYIRSMCLHAMLKPFLRGDLYGLYVHVGQTLENGNQPASHNNRSFGHSY